VEKLDFGEQMGYISQMGQDKDISLVTIQCLYVKLHMGFHLVLRFMTLDDLQYSYSCSHKLFHDH